MKSSFNFQFISFAFLISLVSCGMDSETQKGRDINPGPTYNTTICGEVKPPSNLGLSSGSSYTVTNNQGTFQIHPQNDYVKNSLNNLTTYSDICLSLIHI